MAAMVTSGILLVVLCSVLNLGASGDQPRDINPCATPGSCSQIRHNENDTVNCDCEDGYMIDFDDHRKRRAAVANVSLILANKNNILKISLDKKERSVLINGSRDTSEFDFIYRTGAIFWSDMLNKLYRTTIKENHTDVINENINFPNAVAVDWIYNHIYWTEGLSIEPTIGVANLDGSMRKSLITQRLHKLTAILVNPLEGWLFWSDIRKVSRIERAGLDGTHRQIIVSSKNKWPFSLALDFVQRRIYWADPILNEISSCNYDGSGRRRILHNERAIKLRSSLAVFEDYLYWTNIMEKTVFRANKFNGSDVTKLDLFNDAHSLKVYHPYMQPDGVNHCGPDNGNCSHLCLPAPQVNQDSPKTTCACPDGLNLMSGGQKCVENRKLL